MSQLQQTGPYQLQTSDISIRDVSTVRRMLGGIHEGFVIMAWNKPGYLPASVALANQVANAAIEAARTQSKSN